MDEKLLIAFLGAIFALLLRELVAWLQRRSKRKKLIHVALPHLKRILEDLRNNPNKTSAVAKFSETNYWELVVGDWIYDQLISNLDSFPTPKKLEKTIEFFHHYKVNLSTLRARLDASGGKGAELTIATYQALVHRLEAAVHELECL